MTTMRKHSAGQAASQIEPMNEVQETAQMAQAKDCSSQRRRYSVRDVLRLMKVLDEAMMDIERKYLSMNDVVHVLLDRLDGMMKTRRCSRAELASLITTAGFPVTEHTLKDYLTLSRKDAREGNTHYSELKEQILSQAGTDERTDCAGNAAASLPQEDGASNGQAASDDSAAPGDEGWLASAISSAMTGIEAKAMARQHVRDIYEARKRRKKARNAKKHR